MSGFKPPAENVVIDTEDALSGVEVLSEQVRKEIQAISDTDTRGSAQTVRRCPRDNTLLRALKSWSSVPHTGRLCAKFATYPEYPSSLAEKLVAEPFETLPEFSLRKRTSFALHSGIMREIRRRPVSDHMSDQSATDYQILSEANSLVSAIE